MQHIVERRPTPVETSLLRKLQMYLADIQLYLPEAIYNTFFQHAVTLNSKPT